MMTTWARSINNQAVDVTTSDPKALFESSVAAQFIEVPDGTVNGAVYINGSWTNPQPVQPAPQPTPAQVYPIVSPNTVINCFTVAEQVAIEAALPNNPPLKVFWSRLNDSRLTEVVLALPSVQQGVAEALTVANAAGALAAGATVASRTAEVLAAKLQ
jgi:hypothetical protein